MIREILYKNSYQFFCIKLELVSKIILRINNQLLSKFIEVNVI
jgi:hypothetical protein